MSHQSRQKRLVEIQKCSMLGVPYKKLKVIELGYVNCFMSENKDLSDGEFKAKAHYLFIDDKEEKKIYKNHIQIIEVLMSICD